jgi:hypothetical protein
VLVIITKIIRGQDALSTATTPPSSATNSGEHSRVLQSHCTLMTRKARRRTIEAMMTSRNPTRLSTSCSVDYPADGKKRLPVEKP